MMCVILMKMLKPVYCLKFGASCLKCQTVHLALVPPEFEAQVTDECVLTSATTLLEPIPFRVPNPVWICVNSAVKQRR